MSEKFMSAITWVAAAITIAILFFIVGFILVRGVPHLRPSLFAFTYTSENASLMPALVTTFAMALLTLAAAVPIGIFSAIYLTEYAARGNRAVAAVRTAAETLSGIPSIVFGLFGALFFVEFLGWGRSVLAGALTLSMMILPLVMRSAEEAIKSVPDAYREGAFGLGAGKLRTVFRIVLPSAAPGILAGVILSVGRIVGETAALIFTSGTIAAIPENPMSSAETLAIHMYRMSNEVFHVNEGYATAVVLLAVTAAINIASVRIARRLSR
ncbi:MAG: phosphate ABC transporter permease PstA [Clostridiales bacterium]|jgi:phosphate transport system permease protein|nr:phosphate ABC transporter permease PstA [Clostridiales bacterium]